MKEKWQKIKKSYDRTNQLGISISSNAIYNAITITVNQAGIICPLTEQSRILAKPLALLRVIVGVFWLFGRSVGRSFVHRLVSLREKKQPTLLIDLVFGVLNFLYSLVSFQCMPSACWSMFDLNFHCGGVCRMVYIWYVCEWNMQRAPEKFH